MQYWVIVSVLDWNLGALAFNSYSTHYVILGQSSSLNLGRNIYAAPNSLEESLSKNELVRYVVEIIL